ncbi:MAG: hypothetical protein ACREQR_18390 [Candidatus Binataceae bacterium]
MIAKPFCNVTGVIVIAAMIAIAPGCAASGGTSPIAPAVAASDPTTQVFRNCRELVCTQADVPRCDFSEVVASDGPDHLREDFRCAREGAGTLCEERRRLIGSEDKPLENQVLKFQCSGDPVQCQVLGGNPRWTAAFDLPDSVRGTLSCRARRPAGPPLAPLVVPGPDTGMRMAPEASARRA